jgi:excisionase family DNA binding protein
MTRVSPSVNVPSTFPKLLKVPDVAEQLDVSTDRLYDLVRRNLLPHVKMGRAVRFEPSALENWISSGGRALPREQ